MPVRAAARWWNRYAARTDFFSSRGLGSTWFTVPKAGGKPMTAEWKEALIAARDAGHDLQLHGLTHADCYEFGPPAWPATSILATLQSDSTNAARS